MIHKKLFLRLRHHTIGHSIIPLSLMHHDRVLFANTIIMEALAASPAHEPILAQMKFSMCRQLGVPLEWGTNRTGNSAAANAIAYASSRRTLWSFSSHTAHSHVTCRPSGVARRKPSGDGRAYCAVSCCRDRRRLPCIFCNVFYSWCLCFRT